MAFSYACLILQRVAIPLVLVLSALFRPVGISFVYLLMFFISPFVPVATSQNFKGSVTAYLLILVAISTILILAHIGLQITIVAIGSQNLIGFCTFTELLLRHIGFIDFGHLGPRAVIEWLAPEVLVFCTSVASYFAIKKISTQRPSQLENEESAIGSSLGDARLALANSRIAKLNMESLSKISPFFCLATLFFAAVLRPSVPGGFYFLIFLLCGSYWATFKSLQRGFAILMRFVMVVLVLHIISIVSYQTPWPQQNIPNSTLAARLVGLEPLIRSSCDTDIRILYYENWFNLDSFLSPIAILFSYYALALTSKNLIRTKVSINRDRSTTEPNETTPLVRHNTRKKVDRKSGDPVPGAGGDIAMDSLENHHEDDGGSSLLDQIYYGFVSVGGFIYQNSYIFTNILMMTWSIVYHSWLTFALLIWANVLWMIPNQRKAMMRSSPFIVLYAELLLVAQYIYGMNLTNDELPSKVNTTGINLEQIGLTRPSERDLKPCIPLIVKTLFVLMFWVTLRQFFKEKSEKRRYSTIADMVAPLQITVGASGTSNNLPSRHHDNKKTSKFLKKTGDIIKNLLVRLWIWLLIFVIFLCAITGKQMTAFRICYMALFLFFLLVFQSSSKAWVNIMYGFWLFLIFYAMSILTLIYTYQFDKFDQYWDYYLNISKTLQTDIGLEKYETKDLFLHLVSPTIIVILTVIQVHYFHKRFVASLQQSQATRSGETAQKAVDVDADEANEHSLLKPNDSTKSRKFSESKLDSIKDISKKFFKQFKCRAKRFAKNFKGVFWRFLELHLIKLVYLTAFLCCATEVCVLHILFVTLCVFGVIAKSKIQVFMSRIISLVVSIIILTKMIYQIGYLKHERYDVICNNDTTPVEVQNNAVWFGLEKATAERSLVHLIKKYIIYMVMVTLHAVVSLRQSQMRDQQGLPNEKPPKILFPNVVRADAEKNVPGMLKYLLNFGFYKFGLETTLITLVALITFRQDLFAILYVFWLCILLCFERRTLARIWSVFQCYTATIIILQYILFVGLPPGLCLVFPWKNSPYSNALQVWALLPGDLNYDHTGKLVFDFILLVFINRQKRVFNIEKRYETGENDYPGGTNKSVVQDIENLGIVPFDNPTSDFLSSIRNWLDIIKNAVLCGFYWITLAVVFLAGTNINDVLAIGYLIGSFIFLWQGSDFYLRPIRVILTRWNVLLFYNVLNIAIKTCLQIASCMFLPTIKANACWLVHILGLTCARSAALPVMPVVPGEEEVCTGSPSPTVMVWDAVCFAFIILQLRIFRSHYFCHIINDTKANTILASRGAEIIEDLRQKQIEHRKKHEQEILRKIKRKMEKIRATQQKMLRPIDKPTHFDEHGLPLPGLRNRKRKEIKTHPQAIRAGDYYMFEDMDEKFELDLIEDEVDFLEDQGKISESEKKMNRRKTLFEEKDVKGDRSSKTDKTDKTDKPSTSRDVDDTITEAPESKKLTETESTDVTDKEFEETPPVNPIVRLFEGFLVSLAIRLNRFSRNYRYVNKILEQEKKLLKESKGFERLGRTGASSFFAPFMNLRRQLLNEDDAFTTDTRNPNALITTETDTDTIKQNTVQDIVTIDFVDTSTPIRKEPGSQGSLPRSPGAGDFTFEEDFATRDHHIIIEVLISAWFAILSNTDLICYMVVFIHQVANASIISLPLPLMVFLWGTLSLPRPTKTFWVTLIAYTQALVLIKCIFQFKSIFLEYVSTPNSPLSFPKIIGMDSEAQYANYDLLLLLILFFHRFVLKSQGLWKSEYKEEFVQDGAYVLKDEVPESDDVSSEKSVEETAVVNSGDDTLALAKPNNEISEDQVNVHVNNTLDDSGNYIPGIAKLTSTKYLSSSKSFFFNLVHKARLPSDVYALMFLCDFINFFVLLFGFTAFGSQQGDGDGGVQTYLEENKVPIPFLIMLLIQFILIVIDRALYLRKALVQKIIFHFISVIGIHIWMFFVIPAVTERSFNLSIPPIIFYIIKCLYLLLSSYQIKCGYPKRILGNFLTRGFSLINMISFRVYMLTPFLYELRTILDWVCTDTTMTLFDWLKMEDIFSEIYFIKCGRQMEQDFPAMRAQKKAMTAKITLGGTIVLLIVISIWGPLCLFALGNAVGQPNIPYEVSASLRIGPYDPIYDTKNHESIYSFDTEMLYKLQQAYGKNKHAATFISGYNEEDIAAIVLAGNSPSLWTISPPDRSRLLDDLMQNKSLTCRFTYALSRTPPTKQSPPTISSEVTVELNETFAGRETMIAMLQGNNTEDAVAIPALLPKFIKVLNSGDMAIATQLAEKDHMYRPLVVKLHNAGNASQAMWWEVREDCNDTFYKNTLSALPYAKCDSGIVIYTFNDKKFPSTFTFLTGGGIIGLYTTFVLLASRFLKSFISGQSRRIMFEDLPYVDRVLQLCLDIYLVREALEFALEEDLFAKLLFLYRSPETMIKWTRPKEENNDDETDTDSVRSRGSSHRRPE